MERHAAVPERHLARGPLIVRSRYGAIAVVGVVGAAVAAGMFVLRQDELDADDAVVTAVLLAFGLWLVTQTVGLVARRIESGHAMKIDAQGLHYPGWNTVPWSAIRSARLERARQVLGYRRHDLVLDIDPACSAAAAGNYLRWMFGPVEGLWRRVKPIRIPMVGLDIAPEALLAAIEAMSRQANSDSGATRRQMP